MKVKVAKTDNVLFKIYNTYRNYTPIHVMTNNETIILNTIMGALFLGLLYWIVFVIPSWLVFLGERLYYYLTGQTISISLICSIAVRQIWFNPKAATLRTNLSNMTDFYRKK